MSLGKLNILVAAALTVGAVALVSAGPQAAPPRNLAGQVGAKTTTPPASGAKPAAAAPNPQELTEHPEILTQDFNPQVVSLYGVKIGDKTSKVAKENIDVLTGTLPGIMKLKDGYQLRYNPTNYTVTALVVNNRQALLKANFQDRYDVEFRFGKPDISDDRHQVYLSRRLLLIFNNNEITNLEIR